MDQIADVYSVSGCVNEDFADYINFWKHNGFWLFDSPDIIRIVAKENSISLDGSLLFYYEAHELGFDGQSWDRHEPEKSFVTNVIQPSTKSLEGFDIVTFHAGNAPEHSPLSCNGLARELRTNTHYLLDSFEDAQASLARGAFKNSEPGPYRIFAVYSTPWPELSSEEIAP